MLAHQQMQTVVT